MGMAQAAPEINKVSYGITPDNKLRVVLDCSTLTKATANLTPTELLVTVNGKLSNVNNRQYFPAKSQTVRRVTLQEAGNRVIVHGRGAAVGSSLANLMKAAGYDVTSEYYINDAGNQMHNLALSVNARYLELFGKQVDFPENGYHGADIITTAERIKAKYGDQFLKMPEEERLARFQTLAKEEKLAALKEDLAAFNCNFDVWFSEQSLHGRCKSGRDL